MKFNPQRAYAAIVTGSVFSQLAIDPIDEIFHQRVYEVVCGRLLGADRDSTCTVFARIGMQTNDRLEIERL